MTILGTGAGSTIIDAGGLSAPPDRMFEVFSGITLDLAGVTLTGGGGGGGGAILVRDGGLLNLDRAALVRNVVTGSGGAISINNGGSATITNSVITDNTAQWGGGIFVAVLAGPVLVGTTLVANNQASNGGDDLYSSTSGNDVGEFTSLGNNRITNISASVGFAHGVMGDHVGTVDYVVTSVVDTYNHVDDTYALSVREAIDLANTTTGAEEIWLPAWNFVLTRERTIQPTDTDVSFGDLDIKDTLIIRGISGATSVGWRAGTPADDVFTLLGDYNRLGLIQSDGSTLYRVDAADFVAWDAGLPSADGDEDDDVDDDDYNIWTSHFGNTLTLDGVTLS